MNAWIFPASGSALVVIAYLIGFAYLDGYCEFFDIEVSELEYGPQYIFVHSAPVLGRAISMLEEDASQTLVNIRNRVPGIGIWWLYFLLSVFAALFVGSAWTIKVLAGRLFPAMAMVLLAALAFAAIFMTRYAHEVGMIHAEDNLMRLHPISIIEPDGRTSFASLREKYPKNSLLHLLTTGSTIFVINRFPGGDRWWLIRVPRSDQVLSSVYQD